jgi:hypothetical protein
MVTKALVEQALAVLNKRTDNSLGFIVEYSGRSGMLSTKNGFGRVIIGRKPFGALLSHINTLIEGIDIANDMKRAKERVMHRNLEQSCKPRTYVPSDHEITEAIEQR